MSKKIQLLFVEGKDDVAVMKYLLNLSNKPSQETIDKDGKSKKIDNTLSKDIIHIIDCKSKDKIKSAFDAHINAIGTDNISHIAIMRDADDQENRSDGFGAYESVFNIVANKLKNSFDCPKMDKNHKTTPYIFNHKNKDKDSINISFYILPDNNSPGALEKLIFQTISEKEKECIKKFFDCIEFNLSENRKYKNMIQLYLSLLVAKEKVMNKISTLGDAVDYNLLNLQDNKFKEITNFLTQSYL